MQARARCAACQRSMPRGMDLCFECWRDLPDKDITYCRDCGTRIAKNYGNPNKVCVTCTIQREQIKSELQFDTIKILTELTAQRKDLMG